jgi:beta-glucosidase
MTVLEKIGQMLQGGHDQIQSPADVVSLAMGSVLSGGGQGPLNPIPLEWAKLVQSYRAASLKTPLAIPILYGVDAVHGHNNVRGAVLFPHNIGLGAAGDADLVERVARATAEEMVATGVDWTFAPVLAAARDERWGRTYEAFGETYDLAATLGAAAIRGYQGKRLGQGKSSVLACAKHFVGDGHTTGGKDQGDVQASADVVERQMLPAYASAVEAGVGSVMASYNSINGVKMHCNGTLLTDTLKRRLGFNGFVVSDWSAVEQVQGRDYAEQLANAINAGLDMVMHPKYYADFMLVMKALVGERIPLARVDDAVRRILAIKCELGLFEPGRFQLTREGTLPVKEDLQKTVGSPERRAIAREAVRRSLVLLKNERQVLPIDKQTKRVHLAGRFADDLGAQCGGWSVTWQGAHGAITDGTTLRAAFEQALSKDRVTYSSDGSGAAGADVAVAVIGERPYAEGAGDDADLALDPADVATVKTLKASGIPVVVVLLSGRPLILGEVLELADGVVAAWLPGTEGAGVADVLLGDHAPGGKLTHSWPRELEQVPINVGDKGYSPLFPYGFGLSYAAAPHAHDHADGYHMDFSEVERFARHFDDPGRDAWQRPADVVKLMQLVPGQVVADIGAGTGYFLPHLTRAVGKTGRVLGLDVEPNMVEYMRRRVRQHGLSQVTASLVPPDDPELAAASVDRILIVNTWHHIGQRAAYTRKLARALKAGGSVWIVDFTQESDIGPPADHRLSAEAVVAELQAGGLHASVVPEILPKQYVVRGSLER